jgi:hypothetical protein
MWSRRARARRSALRRFAAIADRIGARDGKLVREIVEGGLVVPDGIGIITIRPGRADEVARAQLQAAVAAGYTDPPAPPCDSARPCVFTQPPQLPTLSVETIPEGSTIRGTEIVVPSGHTGVVITLG